MQEVAAGSWSAELVVVFLMVPGSCSGLLFFRE